MNEFVTPITIHKVASARSRHTNIRPLWRLFAAMMLVAGLTGCATTPAGPAKAVTVEVPPADPGLASANVMYNTRNYSGAVREFDTIITDSDASANSHRLAHLGKALIYLGTDKNWFSIKNAQQSLNAAGQVVPESHEGFAVETDMFMDSIAAQLDTQMENIKLRQKRSGSSGELDRVREERDALVAERDAWLKEQQSLNEAIEKLKDLTLGN